MIMSYMANVSENADETMTGKEFITAVAARTGLSIEEASRRMAVLIEGMAGHLCEGDSISVAGFGTFEVKKRNERVIVNPVSRQRMLVPPRLTLTFKPGIPLKERIK